MKDLLTLFFLFARVGAFTFGGGYAMLPVLSRELSQKKGFATEEELMDYYAIGQLTPGVIAVNVATFIGYKKKGVAGAVAATSGIIFFPVIIITIIAALLTNFAEITYVKHALVGIRVAVLAMIVKTIITMTKKGAIDLLTWIILIVSQGLMLLDIPPEIVVIIAALTGITAKNIKNKKEDK